MIYLIEQLAIWLLLTAGFAAIAGWAFAAQRAAPVEEKLRRERETLLQDLMRLSGEGGDAAAPATPDDASRHLLGVRDARIVELERSLETSRSRADELAGELAEWQRRGQINNPDAEELARLRASEVERERTVDAEASPVEDETIALQTWRLRYFEQRVRYLESQARSATAAQPIRQAETADASTPHLQEWVAREAEARAAFLETELRHVRALPVEETRSVEAEAEPFAADADVDMLLRWRLLYLERRVAHLQSAATNVPAASEPAQREALYDPDRWKWRARYLEARVRHLEQRPQQILSETAAPAAQPIAAPVETPRPAPPSRRAKPAVLASARSGAPDDLTLIEGVSLLQQTTLYSLGVFHFDQIAAWNDENVAWVDQYLRLQGRIVEEEWVEQASELAREGPAAARRVLHEEEV